MVRIIILAFVICLAIGEKVSYDGYQMWRFSNSPTTHDLINELSELKEIDVIHEDRLKANIIVPPAFNDKLNNIFKDLNIHYEITQTNIQSLIDRERELIAKSDAQDLNLNTYNTLAAINQYLADIAFENPALCELDVVGQLLTYEGRNQNMLKISTDIQSNSKDVILMDCGIHAREWVSPATCLYAIDIVVNGYKNNDPDVIAILENNDVYIIPVVNPDGYEYSWTDTRLWRKNRVPTVDPDCMGVDLNRNYDAEWGTVGSSDRPCMDTYHGSGPASENEIQNMQALFEQLLGLNRLKAYFSLHNYSELWMYAYGYTIIPPNDIDELVRVSDIAVDAIASYNGTRYLHGAIADIIYEAAGGPVDYIYDRGVIYSFGLELRDDGTYGFLLPEELIEVTAKEVIRGMFATILAIP